MKQEIHPFENQIFHAIRQKLKAIEKAKELLKENNYIVYEKRKRK
jgi:hypothetical protein